MKWIIYWLFGTCYHSYGPWRDTNSACHANGALQIQGSERRDCVICKRVCEIRVKVNYKVSDDLRHEIDKSKCVNNG